MLEYQAQKGYNAFVKYVPIALVLLFLALGFVFYVLPAAIVTIIIIIALVVLW